MSAYLHYGMVSPFRIAREADEIRREGSEGAEKYVDELLIWRELAQHWMHHGGTDQFGSVPEWARETLDKHKDDPRPSLHPKVALERAQTGDQLWDLAQQSLVRHGELHNNLRMTWGKALLHWTQDPQHASWMLAHLNDTFALDGSDPSSYGGLWWCLGLFDRPFEPERPILGTVRPRDTVTHASRLDLARYRRVVGRLQPGRPQSVAVIGAGIAGLTAARVLVDHGVSVTVFEKARGPGGRTSTRRTEAGRFDHGCPVFDSGDIGRWKDLGWIVFEGQSPRRGTRGANTVAKGLAAMIERATPSNDLPPNRLRFQTRIGSIDQQADGRWRLHNEDGAELGSFGGVVVSAPPSQTAELLQPINERESERIASVGTVPQWTAMVALAEPSGLEPAIVDFEDHDVLGKAVHTPNAEQEVGERWAIHATESWTREHLELEKEDAAERLWKAFARELRERGCKVDEPTLLLGHRWRYAFSESDDFVDPIAPGLVVAGDWTCRSRWDAAPGMKATGIDRAVRSGHRAAFLLCNADNYSHAEGS
ncbi:MAG: FAD-dependent oxidoreductase [Planctomycetota bacterium]